MPKIRDITGQTFNRLTAVAMNQPSHYKTRPDGRQVFYCATWDCTCSCGGTKKAVPLYSLRYGWTQSCGCLPKEQAIENRSVRHKGTDDKPPYAFSKGTGNFYRVWKGIKERCYQTNRHDYPRYGGRDIRVHPDWKSSYRAFAIAAGPRPSLLHSIDRIDTNKDYEPGNIKWSTNKEQSNNKLTNVWLQWKGESVTLMQLAEIEQVSYNLLHKLLRVRHLPIEEAVAQAKKSKQKFSPRIRSRAKKPPHPEDFC